MIGVIDCGSRCLTWGSCQKKRFKRRVKKREVDHVFDALNSFSHLKDGLSGELTGRSSVLRLQF
jgi:hypothetical protein